MSVVEPNGKTFIHPMAVVEPGAALGAGVSIGPFCHVGPQAALGDGVTLVSHVSVMGDTTIGAGCTIFPHAALGAPPQNTKHKGGRSTLVVGRNCTIREAVTMHLGTDTSRGATTVGDNGNFLANTHIGHDAAIGDNVTMANGAMIGGHCEIGDFVTVGALAGIHQFVRVGHHAFIGGLSAVVGDVIPYGMAVGNRASLRGLNIIGLRRSGVPRADIHALREAYRLMFDRAHPLAENIQRVLEEFPELAAAGELAGFLSDRGKRPYCVPSLRGGGGAEDDDSDA